MSIDKLFDGSDAHLLDIDSNAQTEREKIQAMIGKLFDEFFKFATEDKSNVTSISCKLFAEHVIDSTKPTIDSNDELIEAAKAMVERWDSPLWKDLPHTGECINRLRNALEVLKR